MPNNLRNKDKISSSDMAFLGLLTILNILNMLDRNLLSAFSNYIEKPCAKFTKMQVLGGSPEA